MDANPLTMDDWSMPKLKKVAAAPATESLFSAMTGGFSGS